MRPAYLSMLFVAGALAVPQLQKSKSDLNSLQSRAADPLEIRALDLNGPPGDISCLANNQAGAQRYLLRNGLIVSVWKVGVLLHAIIVNNSGHAVTVFWNFVNHNFQTPVPNAQQGQTQITTIGLGDHFTITYQ